MTAPLLVVGWGNRSRGDDALGPMFVEQLCARLESEHEGRVDFLDDYQLQVEHALDLVGRERVLFVDASLACAPPFAVSSVQPVRDASFTSHAMSPAALLQVYCDLHHTEPPACTLLAIRGQRFELGEAPSEAALKNLALAVEWGRLWMA